MIPMTLLMVHRNDAKSHLLIDRLIDGMVGLVIMGQGFLGNALTTSSTISVLPLHYWRVAVDWFVERFMRR